MRLASTGRWGCYIGIVMGFLSCVFMERKIRLTSGSTFLSAGIFV